MSGPYSRLYHKFADEYPAIFDDPRALGTWVQLLVWADAAWPIKPRLPARIVKSALAELIRVGLVTLDGDRYDIRGLAVERLRRQERASAGGRAKALRKQTDSSAIADRKQTDSSAIALPRREEDETRREEDETRRAAARDPVVAYMKLTGSGRPPEGGYLDRKLRSNSERYGFDEWLFAVNQAREIYGTKNDIKNAEVLAEERYVAAKQRAEDERRASMPRITPEQAAENTARVRELTAKLTRREPPKEAA